MKFLSNLDDASKIIETTDKNFVTSAEKTKLTELPNIEFVQTVMEGSSITTKVLATSTKVYDDTFSSSNAQPIYLVNQDVLKGKYLTKIGFRVGVLAGVSISIIYKNVNSTASLTLNDTTHDGVYCTIVPTTTDWTEYDLTNLSDSRITYVTANLTNDRILIPETGRIIGFGTNGQNTQIVYSYSVPASNPDMTMYLPTMGLIDSASLEMDIYASTLGTTITTMRDRDTSDEISLKTLSTTIAMPDIITYDTAQVRKIRYKQGTSDFTTSELGNGEIGFLYE